MRLSSFIFLQSFLSPPSECSPTCNCKSPRADQKIFSVSYFHYTQVFRISLSLPFLSFNFLYLTVISVRSTDPISEIGFPPSIMISRLYSRSAPTVFDFQQLRPSPICVLFLHHRFLGFDFL